MKKLNIAVVGFGLIGKKHVEIINSHKNTLLCGIVDNNKNYIKDLNSEYKFFKTIKDLIAKKKPDGAIIASPTLLHIKHATEFVENNIPVLIEKPIASSSNEALELLELAEKKSVPILVGHHRRYNNIIKTAKSAIKDGLLGQLRSAISTSWFYKPDDYFEEAPWRKKIGAGPISVNLIHDIDVLRYLCGDILSVQAIISPSIRNFENEDLASIIMNFKSGMIANLSVSDSIVSPWNWETNSKENSDFPYAEQNCYFIGGTKGSLSIPDLKIWSHEKSSDWKTSIKTKRLKFNFNDPLQDQMSHFCNVIEKNEKAYVSGLEGLKSLKVIEAIYKSGKLQKPILI